MTLGSLFSGIGGLDLGLERAGFRVKWQVENDNYAQRVLAKHWPGVTRYGDILTLDPAQLEPVDCIAGGFPCQPVSVAGRQLAQADPRWLWPEFARIVRHLRPRYVLVENVPGLLVRGYGDVLRDLAECGYDAQWDRVSAAMLGAPHLRRRIFLIAYPQRAELRDESGWGNGASMSTPPIIGDDGASRPMADAKCERLEGSQLFGIGNGFEQWSEYASWWDAEPIVGRVAHGVPSRVDRLRGLGNAVVPQVAEYVGRLILAHAG